MPIVQASGTQTPTVLGTEYTLADLTTPFGTFLAEVDLTAIAGSASMTVTLNVYTKVLSGGGLNLTGSQTFIGSQVGATSGLIPPVAQSMPIPSDQEIKFTLIQSAGTLQSFPWKVISYP